MEELLLQTFLAFHELDVVDEQHVDFAVAALERADRVVADAVDVLVQERLGRHVAHLVVRVVLVHVRADRVQKVRLAQSCRAIDEKRVVGAAWCFGDALRSCERELVRCALHERVERVARIESDRGASTGASRCGRGAVRRCREWCGERCGERSIRARRRRDGCGTSGHGSDVDAQFVRGTAGLVECVAHERHVAREYAVAHERVRHAQREAHRAADFGSRFMLDADVAEGGEPDCF